MIKHWTAEEEQIIIDMRSAIKSYADIAEVLDRSYEAVKTRGKRLTAQGRLTGSRKGKSTWTQEQLDLLSKEYNYDELEQLIPGKTRRAIQSKCEKLGISKRFPGYAGSSGTMDSSKDTTLYLVDFGLYKKVGVCQVPVDVRLKGSGKYTVLDKIEGMDMQDALDTEEEILRKMRPYRIKGELRRGWSECFIHDGTLLGELIS